MTEQKNNWADSPIHDQIREAGLDNAGAAQSLSSPLGYEPRFTAFEIAEYVCGWLLDGQCLHTVKDAEMAIGNALGQLRCGQDGLLASKEGRARNFLSHNTKDSRGA